MELSQTGYATIDRPWNRFYDGVEKKSLFIDTTPYIGLIRSNKDYPNEVALEYFGSIIRFGELLKNIETVAKSLEEYGVKKNDFVTICSTTTPEIVYLFYAISKIGAVANVMSPFYSEEEILSRINECESKVIIIVDKFIPKYRNVLSKENDKTIVILPLMNSSKISFLSVHKKRNKKNEIDWKDFVNDGAKRREAVIVPYSFHSPMAMVYSSGTTGASKGILLSVDSFQRLVNAYGNSGFDTSRKQSVYQNIPPWHSTGLSLGINFPLSYGVKVCTDPRFDHDVFIKNVLKFKPDYILTNTTMFQGFTFEKSLKRLKGKSLSFLKYPVEGGEPLTDKDIANIERVFRQHGSSARLLNGYGQCECGATVTTDITSHKFSDEASGIPLPEITTIGIFDDNYNELKYGERGNILVKTEIGMLEYFKNPKATDDFFYTDHNGDKWSKTGDIGYINDDGSLVVLGRKMDYSEIDGVKFYNFDVEKSILKSNSVKLCEIQKHPKNSNKLVAHIVLENDVATKVKVHSDTIESLLEELRKRVFKDMRIQEAIPSCFCIWDSFPSAHSGKRDVKLIMNRTDGIIELEGKVNEN